jgi:hypothetical protein
MCEPMTLLGIGSYVAGQVGEGVAGIENAKTLRGNAEIAEKGAADALARGGEEAGRLRSAATQLIGRQRTAFGASGVDVASDAVQALTESTRSVSEQDVETIRLNAAREAWGLSKQAEQFREQGRRELRKSGVLTSGLAGRFLEEQLGLSKTRRR